MVDLEYILRISIRKTTLSKYRNEKSEHCRSLFLSKDILIDCLNSFLKLSN